MAYQETPNGYEIKLEMTDSDGGFGMNILHCIGNSGDPVEDNLVAIQTVVLDWIVGELSPATSNFISFDKLTVTDISTEFGQQLVISTLGTGSVASGPDAGNVTIAVTKRTGLVGRSRRGRVYHYGVPTTWTAQNYLVAPGTTNIPACWNQLLVDMAAVVGGLAVLSRWEDGVLRTEGLLTPITTFGLSDNVLDSMRTRLPGRGI